MSVATPPPIQSIQAGANLGGRNSGVTFQSEKGFEGNEGSMAKNLTPGVDKNQTELYLQSWQGMRNVVKDYPWTISNIKNRDNDVPYIRLVEYKCNEAAIWRQVDFYQNLTPQILGVGTKKSQTGVLDVYKEMFPKDQPTDFSYWFPYFNETGFELNTPNWKQLEPAGEALKNVAGGIEKMARNILGNTAGRIVEGITQATELAFAVGETTLKGAYPVVNVFDRPRIFAGHNERNITISFPLFNTINDSDWKKNRDLIYTLMSQNLYNKRDIITGVPPVFYDVYIPGQYYCYAACMTDINVKNLGNTRLLSFPPAGEYIIPDAYQITLTLTEMVQPSKNQFEAVTNGAARSFVNSSIIETQQAQQELERSQQQAIVGQQMMQGAMPFGIRLP